MERLTVGFAPLMSVTEGEQHNLGELPENSFRGIASVFGSIVDAFMPTIIDSGAFTKTLQEQTRGIKILWQHNPDEPIGVPTNMFESGQGLVLQAQVSQTQRGKDALTLLRDGVIDGLSIGFDPIKQELIELANGDVIRHIKELRLWEISLVTWGADPNARITEVNSHPAVKLFQGQTINTGKLERQTIQRFLDLPVSGGGEGWDSEGAKDRVRTWAKAEEAPNQKWSRSFLYWTEDGKTFDNYQMQVADIVDGELTVIPELVFAAGAAAHRGDVPSDKAEEIKRHLTLYYRKMRDVFDDSSIVTPWEQGDFNIDSLTHYSVADACYIVGTALTEGLPPEVASAALALVTKAESHSALTSVELDDCELMERQLMEAQLAMTETFSAVDPQ